MTSRERRVGGNCVFERASGVSYPVRTGPAERRVASYRPLMDWFCRNVIEAQDMQDIKQMHDLLAALRRPTVTEDGWEAAFDKAGLAPSEAATATRVAVERLK